MMSGDLTVEFGGESLTVPERSFVVVPRGRRHRHILAEGTHLLTVFSPGHVVPH